MYLEKRFDDSNQLKIKFEKANGNDLFSLRDAAIILYVPPHVLKNNVHNNIGMKPTRVEEKIYFSKNEIVKYNEHPNYGKTFTI